MTHGGSHASGNASLDSILADALNGVGGDDAEEEVPFNRQLLGDVQTFRNGAPTAMDGRAVFYAESDVYLPLSLDANGRFALQRALRRAGWLSGDVTHPGQWDAESQDAFRDLLSYANQEGVDWRDALGQSLDAQQAGSGFGGAGGGGTGSGRSMLEPLTIQLPNEDDVRKGVEDVFRGVTDVDGGEEFYQEITERYMDHLRNIQLRDYEARARETRTVGANTTAMEAYQRAGRITTTEPESLESFASDIIEKERPEEFRNARIGDAEETFVDVMTRSYG